MRLPREALWAGVLSSVLIVALTSPLFSQASISPSEAVIRNVTTSVSTFDPSRKESVRVRYVLASDATVSVSVLDSDRTGVRRLVDNRRVGKGQSDVIWDGRDSNGRLVPNESYYFVIVGQTQGGERFTFDPMAFSGGEFGDVTTGVISKRTGTISYELSRPSRVLLRAGVPGSALLKTIVDWEPRTSGGITEYWKGRDEDDVIDVLGLKGRTIILTYMTLPEQSLIAYGNANYDYREYKQRYGGSFPRIPIPARTNARKVSPHFTKDRVTDRSFRVKVSFPELDKSGSTNLPTAKDRILVNLDVDPKDRDVLADQQYEVILFVDTVFHSEEERGYLPFRYPLELSQLPPGEHIITANVITFGDQVGIGSRKIKVVK